MKDFVVNQIFDGTLLASFPIAIIAGLISFISPCVLPLVPGYLSFAAGISSSKGKVFAGSILFVSGFTVLFISYGALFGGLGSKILDHEGYITKGLGLLTIVMGIIFMGRFPMMRTFRPQVSVMGGLVGAPILGFAFGVGWTPCIGPALAAVETLAFKESSALRGAILSLGYCTGLGLPFIFSGLFLDRSARLRHLLSRKGNVISKTGGVFFILIGLLQVLGIWSEIMISLRSLISKFTTVL